MIDGFLLLFVGRDLKFGSIPVRCPRRAIECEVSFEIAFFGSFHHIARRVLLDY